MCSAPPPRTALLPIKHEELGFRRIVFDRERAFMTLEIARIRDVLMSSEALIAKAKVNPSTDMLADIFTTDTDKLFFLMQPFISYVADTAWGDSGLRWAGHLPPVAPFAPEQPVLACGCQGHPTQEGVIGVLKSTHKPDWQAFLDYAEQERVKGRVAAASAFELRTQLQLALEKLNSKFLKMMHGQLQETGFPYDDMAMLHDEADFYHLIDQLEPLPEALIKGMDAVDPIDYSIEQLEQLRLSGKKLRESIARMQREKGNADFARAATLKGAKKKQARSNASGRWLLLTRAGGYDAAAATGNMALMSLQDKQYDHVIMLATGAVMTCCALLDEAAHYSIFRAASAKAFATGREPELDDSEKRQLTDEEYAAVRVLMWKVLCRRAKAHIALCLEDLSGRGTLTEQAIESARKNRDEAAKDYNLAKDNKYAPEPTPMEEIVLLDKTFRKRLEEHVRSRKSLGA